MQLNFRDCKAKIRQVDAHATLGSGVVVQVSVILFIREINPRLIWDITTFHSNSFLWYDLHNQHTLELLTLTTCKSCSSWGQECRSYAKLNLFLHLPNWDSCPVLIFGLRFAFHYLLKLWQCLWLDDGNNIFFVTLLNYLIKLFKIYKIHRSNKFQYATVYHNLLSIILGEWWAFQPRSADATFHANFCVGSTRIEKILCP